jgi:hypothetical protein
VKSGQHISEVVNYYQDEKLVFIAICDDEYSYSIDHRQINSRVIVVMLEFATVRTQVPSIDDAAPPRLKTLVLHNLAKWLIFIRCS